MRNLIFTSLTLLISALSIAQPTEKKDSKKESKYPPKPYNQWSVGAQIGWHDGIHDPGIGITKMINLHHYGIEGRYMRNNRWGWKLDASYDYFQWVNLGNNTNYIRVSAQPVINLRDVLHFDEFSEKFGLLAHFGGGYSAMWNPSVLIETGTGTSGPLLNMGKVDHMLNGIFGIQPQYKIGKHFSIFGDLSMTTHIRQDRLFDFLKPVDWHGGWTGYYMTLNFGANYYIGKYDVHADWVTCKRGGEGTDMAAIIILQNELKETKDKLLDNDNDGVINFFDLEPNSAPGATVNTHGVTITAVNPNFEKLDSDGDSIPDAYDLCPYLPGNIKGCPDFDEDNIPDIIDACPTIKNNTDCNPKKQDDKPKVEDNPNTNSPYVPTQFDTDGDSFNDDVDICPLIPGKLNGCPDSDDDSIPDVMDSCPRLKGLPKYNGCPTQNLNEDKYNPKVIDTDNDGIYDSDDYCPHTPGQVNGCPDSDNDKIPDILDRCPDTYGLTIYNGCNEPNDSKNPSGFGQLELYDVLFETESYEINPAYRIILTRLAIYLTENPTVKLNAVGHTDIIGSIEYNNKLSLNRVNACVNFLVSKGVDKNRFKISYKGKSEPKYIGNSKEINAANRRVSFSQIR